MGTSAAKLGGITSAYPTTRPAALATIAGAASFMRWRTDASWRTVTKPWSAMASGVSAEGRFRACNPRISRTSSGVETLVSSIGSMARSVVSSLRD